MNLSCYGYDAVDTGKAEPYLKGKIIAGVVQSEYTITLTFRDGPTLKCAGASWGGNSLDVEFSADGAAGQE
jgi:hypothetical protein